MVWSAKGDERVKSYRLYRELEELYSSALSKIERLQHSVRHKDELIRRLAAELASNLKPEVEAGDESVHHLKETAEELSQAFPPQPPRSITIPVQGDGNRTVETTESGTIRGLRTEAPEDPLAHIQTKKRKKTG